jgi:hypothetical protein
MNVPLAEVQRFDAAVRRVVLTLRKLVDAADERVHSWEILVRAKPAEISVPVQLESAGAARTKGPAVPSADPLAEDEFGGDRIPGRVVRNRQPKRATQAQRRRRGIPAAAFDLRFSR